MLPCRITALNDDSESDSSSDDEPKKVAKEAEETIAVSEYMRALTFQKHNNDESALILFRELLDTQVLDEVSKNVPDNKLFFVKYNCYKNIGLIYANQEKNDLALEFLLKAIELDDTDVYILSKLGNLSLQLNRIDTAKHVFEKCLIQNPNHWPSGDGILKILCLKEAYNEAYGWALNWYDKDPHYKYGLDVILEIRHRFNELGLEYMEKCWNIKFKDTHLKRTNFKSVFPDYSCDDPIKIERANLTEFKIDKLTWLTIGQFIINAYEKYNQNILTTCYHMTLDDLLLHPYDDKFNQTINGNGFENNLNVINEESNEIFRDDIFLLPTSSSSSSSSPSPAVASTPPQNDTGECQEQQQQQPQQLQQLQQRPKKTKSRRRGSDLSFLEQWGWHKNKNYVQKKKNQCGRNENDQTINGYLRRIFAKHFNENNFDNEKSYNFNVNNNSNNNSSATNLEKSVYEQISCDAFQCNTTNEFHLFINELKNDYFDLFTLIQKWPKYIAKLWEQPIPLEIQDIYMKIHEYFTKHYDLSTWNTLEIDDYQSAYRTTIFYLELFHDRILEETKNMTQMEKKSNVDKRWYLLLNHVLFHSGFIGEFNDKEYFQLRKRLYWLQYCLATFQSDLNASIDSLHMLQEMLTKQSDKNYKIKFPNQKRNNLIENDTVKNLRTNIERTIRLTNIRKLYNEKQHEEIVIILEESLTNLIIIAEKSNRNNPILKITTQFEVLLESLWNLERFSECLQWSEHCFDYSVNLFLTIPIGSHRQYEWADIINYILTYIYQLIVNESIFIVCHLKRYESRLVQNLIKILSHQLDTTLGCGSGSGGSYDTIKYPMMLGAKNTNETPLINAKMPWIILHEIAQHDDDLQIPLKKRQQKLQKESRQAAASSNNINNNNNMTNGSTHDIPVDGNENNENDEEEEETTIPHPIMLLFTAHEYLGNQKWCTKDNGQFLLNILDIVGTRLRAPNLEQFRDILMEHLEQITYCLYGYPAKRVRLRHIEEHDSTNIDLTWDRSIQLFDIYRPDKFPEFNSYKNDSISIEMEQLLQRIIALIPNEIDPNAYINGIDMYINGEIQRLPEPHNILPYRINCIYYLLADHYFKNRDFVKSVKYYVLDLTTFPNRFDSWAGIALSKASNIETKLNSCDTFSTNEFLSQSEEALRCFERCFKIDDKQIPLWIEYGNFEYTMHSFCSRSLKQSSATLSMERFAFLEEKKEQCLNIAYNCFKTVDTNKVHRTMANHNNNNSSSASEKSDMDHQINMNNTNDGTIKTTTTSKATEEHFDDTHDEKWLYHYMLGKIAEKRKKPPNIYLEHYIKSAKYLFESNATYPFKINYSNPQNLSIEALEIFYRITSCIVKYVEHNPKITKVNGKLILSTLKNLSSSPFALNQAKIDDNSINEFKRKLSLAASDSKEAQPITKQMRMAMNSYGKSSAGKQTSEPMEIGSNAPDKINNPSELNTSNMNVVVPSSASSSSTPINNNNNNNNNIMINETRRKSSQSVYKIIVGKQKTETDSSSSDSSSGSDDESSSSDENMEGYLDNSDIELIYRTCIKNLEECITRFPEHYKSIYRLATIYFNAPKPIKDLHQCKMILLNMYTTNIRLPINGLFYERKINNFFNGIWRIPPSEIDRPGSFSAHLSKCVVLLMEVLRLTLDHNTLLELAVQLQRNPEPDKRYLKDDERKELYQQAISLCIKAIREQLKQIEFHQHTKLLDILIDIYKAHKTCTKYMQQKENNFSTILIDAYRMYISRLYSIKIPESINVLDVAVKLCLYEINRKKNCEKNMIPYEQIDQLPSFLNPAHVFATTIRQLEIQKQQQLLQQQQQKLQQQLEQQLKLQQQYQQQRDDDDEQQKKNEMQQQQFEQQQQRLQILQQQIQQDNEMHQLVVPVTQQQQQQQQQPPPLSLSQPTNLSMTRDNNERNQSIINYAPALPKTPTTPLTTTNAITSVSNTRSINSPLNNVSIIPRSITPPVASHSATPVIRASNLANSSSIASTFTSTITTPPTFTPSTATIPSSHIPYSMIPPSFQPTTQSYPFNQQHSGMPSSSPLSSSSSSSQFSSIHTSTMASGNAPRPRGRPPGRKRSSSPNILMSTGGGGGGGGNYNSSSSSSTSINHNPLSNLSMSQLQSYLSNSPMEPATMAALIALYNNPTSIAMPAQFDSTSLNNLLTDYYKLFGVPNLSQMQGNLQSFTSGQMPPSQTTMSTSSFNPSSSSGSQITSSPSTKLPQLDMKTLIASAANKVATATSTGSTAVISVGSGQLSITPSITTTSSKSTAHHQTTGTSSSFPPTTTTNYSNDLYSPSQQLRSPTSALTITKESPAPSLQPTPPQPKPATDNFSIPTNPYDYKYTNPRQQQNYQAYHSLLSKNQTTITLDSSSRRPSSMKRLSPTPASPVAAKIPFRRSSCYPGDFPKSLSITPQLSTTNYSSSPINARHFDGSQSMQYNRDSNAINSKRPSVNTKSGAPPKAKVPKKSLTPGPSPSFEQSSFNLPGPLPYSHQSSAAAAAAAASLQPLSGTTITPIQSTYLQQNQMDYLSTANSLAVAHEYQRNIAMMNQYSDLMKTLPSSSSSGGSGGSSSYLEQFDNFINNSQTERMKQNIRQQSTNTMTSDPSSSATQPKRSNVKGKPIKKDIVRTLSISPSSSANLSLSLSPNSMALNRNYVTPYQSMSPGGRGDGQSVITSNNNNNNSMSGINSRMYNSPTPPHPISSSALSPMGNSSILSNPSFTVPSPITVRSPKQSPVGAGVAVRLSPSPTLMSSGIQPHHQPPSYRTSPTKTLQEKLAERQKAIQQLELSGNSSTSLTRSTSTSSSSPLPTPLAPYPMRSVSHGNVGLSSPLASPNPLSSAGPISGPLDDNARTTTTTTTTNKGSKSKSSTSRKSARPSSPCVIILD